MREIKFRGKLLDNGEWVYGNFVRGCVNPYNYIIEFGDTELCRNYIAVDPVTIGQYTGLYDENGIDIYEGDIVSTDLAVPYLIVEFRNGAFMFKCNDGGESYYDMMLPLEADDNTIRHGEVIGNIHDNPELLEGEL